MSALGQKQPLTGGRFAPLADARNGPGQARSCAGLELDDWVARVRLALVSVHDWLRLWNLR